VTLTQTQLPASWLLFASALGLAGWLSRRKRALEQARSVLAGSS
jgi:hypothetical protein